MEECCIEDPDVGILIFTNEKVLKHKMEGGEMYWRTRKIPNKFTEKKWLENSPRVSIYDCWYELKKEFPIYFAVNGQIKGYFIIHGLDDDDNFDLLFDSSSWHKIKDGEVLKPSQGWRYYPK